MEQDNTIENQDNDRPELKMWLLVREDLEISKGKLAGQSGHAFMSAILQVSRDLVDRYLADNQPKIVVRVKNLDALLRSERECQEIGLNHALITDAGRTEFPEPTKTVMAVGPCYRDELPRYLQRLRLL